ncbi:unnamed protein product, partial [Choristocarpus tenellus]
EFHALIVSLDRRGKMERMLKDVLQERFDIAELERNVQESEVQEDSSVMWRTSGSEHLGKRVRRVFGRRMAEGVVTKWVSEKDNEGMALWHIKHEDGDEEDLEEYEVIEGINLAVVQGEDPHTAAA